jgi:hypothetical protein
MGSQTALAAPSALIEEKRFAQGWRYDGMIQSVKLAHLLRLIWSSPIFGDAFPDEVSIHFKAALSQMEVVYRHGVETLEPCLLQGMPHVNPAKVRKLVQKIVSTTAAFCTAIVADEISDTERLKAVALIVCEFYWADMSVDSGDQAMQEAIGLLKNRVEGKLSLSLPPSGPMTQARLLGLARIEEEMKILSPIEDLPKLRELVIQETFYTEVRKHEITQAYGNNVGPDFKVDASYATQAAEILIRSVAIIDIVAAVYALYRQSQPDLPNLEKVFNQPSIVELLYGPYNAAIRIIDDLSDIHHDNNHYPGWAGFSLNIFNQPHPELVGAFLQQAGLKEETTLASLLAAFTSSTEADHAYILEVFLDLIRNRLEALPEAIWKDYKVFLTIAKRTLEAAYVNFMGDLEAPRSA